MRRIIILLVITLLTTTPAVAAQESTAPDTTTLLADSAAQDSVLQTTVEDAELEAADTVEEAEGGLHKQLKTKFIDGNVAGEMEQAAMALPVLKVLRGQAAARTYTGKNVWEGFEGITF